MKTFNSGMTFLHGISIVFLISLAMITTAQTYPVAGTNQTKAFNNSSVISTPTSGQAFYGQNANYPGNTPSYSDNGDGTITDNITGLMWQQTADMNNDGLINSSDKKSYSQAVSGASSFNLAGYNDWRLPTIKELYSLILFSGIDISGPDPLTFIPFIDTVYFDFGYGDESAGERLIDAQYASSTLYVETTMGGDPTMFGVNFADGRIKGYGLTKPGGGDMTFYVKYVRGSSTYGINDFTDNGDGTVTDNATGLMWMQNDNGAPVLWENALSYCENLSFAGHNDWRLPDAKELQSIVDYSRSPGTTSSAAINALFNCTQITVEDSTTLDYPFYWTSTTHENISGTPGSAACYVAFGKAYGWMELPPGSGIYNFWDVHGAGAQRSDPKTGDPASYPYGFGPQGDVIRIYNYVRPVRYTGSTGINNSMQDENSIRVFPNPANDYITFVNVTGECDIADITITDLSGKVLISQTASGNQQIDISMLPAGMYFFQCNSQSSLSSVKLIVY